MSNMGRPKKTNPKNVKFNVCIDQDLNKAVEEHIEKTGATRAELVRRGLRLYLEQNK